MKNTGLTELTQIDGVENIYLGRDYPDLIIGLNDILIQEVSKFSTKEEQIEKLTDLVSGFDKITLQEIKRFKYLTEQRLSLTDLESSLRFAFGAGETIMTSKSVRFATCIGWKNTQLHRNANNIILPGTDMVNNPQIQNNMGNNVVDPIGWASRAAAPNDYGLLGKIPAFRPLEGNSKFNQELYKELFNTIVEVGEILGYAVEIKDGETAIMPVVEIKGAEDIISIFNETLNSGDIQTAKHFALNR